MSAPAAAQRRPAPPPPGFWARAARTAVRLRLVIVLAVEPVPRRGCRHWEMAGQVVLAGVVLFVSALIARGVFGRGPLMVLSALAVTGLVAAVTRVEVPEEVPPGQEPKTTVIITPKPRKEG
jgi:hypothetical protein